MNWIKKNWLWILIAIVIIVIVRRKMNAERNAATEASNTVSSAEPAKDFVATDAEAPTQVDLMERRYGALGGRH